MHKEPKVTPVVFKFPAWTPPPCAVCKKEVGDDRLVVYDGKKPHYVHTACTTDEQFEYALYASKAKLSELGSFGVSEVFNSLSESKKKIYDDYMQKALRQNTCSAGMVFSGLNGDMEAMEKWDERLKETGELLNPTMHFMHEVQCSLADSFMDALWKQNHK